LAVVAFGGIHAFAFEIHIVHERVEAEGFGGHAAEVRLDARALCGRGGGEDFR